VDAKKKLTATNLKEELWKALMDLQKGKIEPGDANAVAYQARAITSVIKLELQINKASNRRPGKELQEFTQVGEVLEPQLPKQLEKGKKE